MTLPLLLLACVGKPNPGHPADDSAGADSHDSAAESQDSHADSDSESVRDSDSGTDTDPNTDSDPDSAHDTGTGDTGSEPVTLDFVLIPAQTFQMGCTASQYDCSTDETEHTVTLTHDFYIANLEVTRRDWLEFAGADPSYDTACGPTCPVEYVSWQEAAEYANWVSAAEGLTDCYTCDGTTCIPLGSYTCTGYRLPTEAEWEAAARCGTDYTYAGSDRVEDVAWYHSNSGWGKELGGQLAPNDCGLYDMSGNVLEWVQDSYQAYSGEAVSDPELDLGLRQDRGVRGGAWAYEEVNAQVGVRAYGDPHVWYYTVGFRLARTPP